MLPTELFALRPAGGKLHGCRCGQGVGEMQVPACRRAYLLGAVTTAPVGNVSELKVNQLYLSRWQNSSSPKAFRLKWKLNYSLTWVAIAYFC